MAGAGSAAADPGAAGAPRRRQQRSAVKASLLDDLSQDVLAKDCEPSGGLTAEEVRRVHEELAQQLYNWALRLTARG